MEHQQYYLPQIQDLPTTPQGDFVSSANVSRTDKTLNIKDKYIFNDNEAVNKYGQTVGRTAFSTLVQGSVYTAAVSDFIIGITSLSYAPSVGLPRPQDVGPGKTYIVKDEAGGAGTTTITVRSVGDNNIDGAGTSTITANYGVKAYYSDGNLWFTY